MSRCLFVVHRYAPYPGGSEYYVRDMAEKMLSRGHDVTVLTHQHQGDLNGVKVTSNYLTLADEWDMIIVHGGDVSSQNVVHANAAVIESPVLYMIIKPSDSEICVHGMKHHRFIAYSTSMDIEHCRKHSVLFKSRRVRHGIVPSRTIAAKVWPSPGPPVFVSAGGFYPHKAMVPLAEAFEKSDVAGELHLFGYGEGPMPKETDRVKVFFGKEKEEVMSAIANADAYIMNSYEEGFGLVLLEAMMNKTPWYARNIAGAYDMKSFGTVYSNESELMSLLKVHTYDPKALREAYDYVMSNHTITDTVTDIEAIIIESMK